MWIYYLKEFTYPLKKKKMKLLGWILLFIVLWLSIPFLLSVVFTDIKKWSDVYGPFGDAFGSVNALFSGLALAGVIYAILLQRKDLDIQSTELKLSRREFHLNRISNIIYQQIKLVESAVNAITFKDPFNKTRNVAGYQALFILEDIIEKAPNKTQSIHFDDIIWDDAGPHLLRLLNILINSVAIIEEIVIENVLDVTDHDKSEKDADREQLVVLFERNIGDEIKIVLNRVWNYSKRSSVMTNAYHQGIATKFRTRMKEFKTSNLMDDSLLTNDKYYLIK